MTHDENGSVFCISSVNHLTQGTIQFVWALHFVVLSSCDHCHKQVTLLECLVAFHACLIIAPRLVIPLMATHLCPDAMSVVAVNVNRLEHIECLKEIFTQQYPIHNNLTTYGLHQVCVYRREVTVCTQSRVQRLAAGRVEGDRCQLRGWHRW